MSLLPRSRPEREFTLKAHGFSRGLAYLGRWYWRFAEEVGKCDDGGFYSSVAAVLAAVLDHEIELLDAEPEWVPDDPAVTEWNEGAFAESGRSCGGCGSDPSTPEETASTDPEIENQFGPTGENQRPDPDTCGPLNRSDESDDSG